VTEFLYQVVQRAHNQFLADPTSVHKVWTQAQKYQLLLGIALGLTHLHADLKVTHRQLNLRAIIVNDRMEPRILGWKWAVCRDEAPWSAAPVEGDPFTDPRRWDGFNDTHPARDWFSYGLILLAVMTNGRWVRSRDDRHIPLSAWLVEADPLPELWQKLFEHCCLDEPAPACDYDVQWIVSMLTSRAFRLSVFDGHASIPLEEDLVDAGGQ
jgi:hypothetical protein